MKHARSDYNERIQDLHRKIPEDEPVFLLRAQDRLAADTVDFWADALESNGGPEDIVAAAREHANKMRDWSPRKLPDAPPETLYDSDFMVDLGPPDLDDEDPLAEAE